MNGDDKASMATLKPKHELIRDRVRGVCTYLHTGFYLWGEGGTSKSYTVLDELQNKKADYVLHNSRMTGRGLVDTLGEFPTSIHVIEDAESMFDDKRAWGVLRSALHSQSRKRPMEREISWTAHNVNIRFVFTGGLIIIANKSLDNIPELKAMKTRIATLQLVASFAEISALMRSVAEEGYRYGEDYMTPTECLKVANFVIERMQSLARPLDMRVFVNGCKDYIQHKSGQSHTGWEDLIETRLKETTVLREKRADKMAKEAEIAAEIAGKKVSQAKKLALWKERTGKSERAYWRRLKNQ
jgi:hypothetical protein